MEIPEGITVTEGMLYSNGEFKENPAAPEAELTALKARIAELEAVNAAYLGLEGTV